ncbi:tetratricopeptide repeat protein [Chryseobacterium echinoideorum]|uniref:tetratricopeptide repeat protein n=1 Tax=Chryseobacterium echinoideorum TaxID=1549648 RepID=UPI0011863073|nr:tetratricopeptide repeat protein [Chryseobacterium echinoideorum]
MFRLSFILLFVLQFIFAQDKSYPDIDSALMFKNHELQKEGKLKEAIAFNFQLIEKSRQKNYKKGIGWGYVNIGNLLSSLDHYEESLKYLELAEKELRETDNPFLKATIQTEIGKINHFLGLYEIALKDYNNAIVEAKKNKDTELKKHHLNYIYSCKADNFEFLKRYDSMQIYFLKAYKLSEDPITAANIAHYFITYKKDEIDSAKYYLDAANVELKTNDYDLHQKLVVLQKYGNYYYELKEYQKALDYYLQSLEIAKKIDKGDEKKIIYQLLSKTYKSLNDDYKSAEYLQKYSILNDSLNAVNKNALSISVDQLVKEKEIEKERLKNKNHNTLIIISLLAVTSLLFGSFFYIRKKKEKEKIIKNQQEEITQKEIEKKNLEYKVNDSFDEIIQLAKSNSPSFLIRFKEVYPEFCERILILYPEILNSELTFCAYLKLNFSTKEIAKYTFVTEKAVQARKSRIRKKFNISSNEDIYVWFGKI